MANLNQDIQLYETLKTFSKINEQFAIVFKGTEKNRKLQLDEKIELLIHYVARDMLPNPEHFEIVVAHFSQFLSKFLSIGISHNTNNKLTHDQHIVNCIFLGKLIHKRPDLSWYAIKYFEATSSPFHEEEEATCIKKPKMRPSVEFSELEFVESCYLLLKSNPAFYIKSWNWSDFIDKYLLNKSVEIQWITCHCIALVTSMNEKQLNTLINIHMSEEENNKLACKFDVNKTLAEKQKPILSFDQNPVVSLNKLSTSEVVEVSGIYLQKHANSKPSDTNIILVDSTTNNLKKIALGLTENKAVCLQGPVGSGKTLLVEYLAAKTGRKMGEDFIKVQLGDQTDSKMLLGTYRCTDIPGEFVWQAGVITQAVMEGHWLLLEDIDSASVDIASVLSSLLENNCLAVPGYRDSVGIKPGFQLFFTQRLVSTISGHHKKHSNAMSLLEKHLLQINIDPLAIPELKQIVIELYPKFTTIADRMLSVFQLFTKSSNTTEITIPKTSRLISTRDFFKWCSRAAIDFDVQSQTSALKVLQDAIDVFCCSYPKEEDALHLAREISTHLGIIHQKAEYFFKNYKPNMSLTNRSLVVGRASVKRDTEALVEHQKFYFTRPSSVLLERVMSCVKLSEPVLLVGETGTGKTSSVQFLANTIGQKLVVINMNQQSDSADLLGGFKPVDLKFIVNPIRSEFEHIFGEQYKLEPNRTFLGHVAYCYNEQRWTDLVTLMAKPCEAAIAAGKQTKLLAKWTRFRSKLEKLSLQLKQKNALAFAFIEGSLVKAVEQGYWVLLDEINLANAETLECLSGLLEGSDGSLCLLERGDKKPVRRHPNFTLFACMNPSTDVGKKDLPAGLRNRFTEFYVDELTAKSDLLLLVGSYLDALSLKEHDLGKIVDFYLKVRKATETSLTDGLGHRPHFSLRSLCRALAIAAKNPCGTFKKSLYEAFCLSFLTQLDAASYDTVEKMIAKYLVGDELKSVTKQPIPEPKSADRHLQFEGYWMRQGDVESATPANYILTDSVRKNLRDLVRIVSIGRLPVLLQGDTSVGKTSLITYLARSSGNKCVRINNHEHTDLQEYVGAYMADCTGKLVFREGLLVEAMRHGHWIILDELNLAPTDVLEALNRVLDDNRELFIPETQETVKASANFMLFATQNPPGAYGGRKMLSRAFRNRFVELHFNEIPALELQFILHKRCEMAPSYAGKMIRVMSELQMRRRGSAAFAGKQGFITLRDLFRWGERYRLAQNSAELYDWDQHLADEGYLVLAGRVRRPEERAEIGQVLQKHLKRSVDPMALFTLTANTSLVTRRILETIEANKAKFGNIEWTFSMRQLAVLVAKAFQFSEPVLLVGETGGGKTTVCKLIAEQNGQQLATVNCHMHTESSDFIGGLRPVRDHASDDANRLFEWVDGPLIRAMLKGDVFLADEISLADDSVLERLNSLLEPERSLLLAEKGSTEMVVAHDGFHFIGTMNPGGDFGKKELSPALRNRFTEIWCESCTNRGDLIAIIERNLRNGVSFGNQEDGSTGIGANIMDFVQWFRATEIGKRFTVSVRDILTWVDFINKCDRIDVFEAYLHGANLTFLDGLGSGVTGTENLKSLQVFRQQAEHFLKKQLAAVGQNSDIVFENLVIEESEQSFGIRPFFIPIGDATRTTESFSFNAPTTLYNTLRVLRGMQLNKAILLEGSPGVGKTSLVGALAKCSRHKIFRVNLSDQTDISDLFGADLPVEGGTGGQFSWRDGPLLQALRQGHWILLDELNLASQSVLEGLNACLDHRGEIFIPELGKTFQVRQGTRFFACQNPLKQGGSRRGLPKSFLNRFIQVYVNSLTRHDYEMILKRQFPMLSDEVLRKMLDFNERIGQELEAHSFGQKGAPWEFNLRDLTRWCEATFYQSNGEPGNLVELVYGDRMRTLSDRIAISRVFSEVFGYEIGGKAPVFFMNSERIYFGDVYFDRNESNGSGGTADGGLVLRSQLGALRSLAYCVNLNWMSLLVGGSASGKSAIVRVLADLAGKSLKTLPVTSAMDTTDLLGGFEQTDYTRHLEEMGKETERILFASIREDLQQKSLLQLWEKFTTVHITAVDTARTMEAEAQAFLKKLDQLHAIWQLLPHTEQIGKLIEKCEKIRASVQKEKSLNSGGRFEWVDSVLIKCLQDGSWLLVDNVNLCSAAVLDRLNALLEPNGVLTVGERGVDANGQMVEIRPHPAFRLFLTMDPKNGEISRAMRNRGIEIYLLSDTERGERNTFDFKSLIGRQGLTNATLIEYLLRLHDFVCDLILGERPSINELLRAAALIAQLIRYGTTPKEAFVATISEVYYKTRSAIEFNGNDFNGVVRGQVDDLFNQEIKADFFNETVTLDTQKLKVHSTLELVKQQFSAMNAPLEKITDGVAFSLVHFYTFSHKHDLDVRHLYVNSVLNNGHVFVLSMTLCNYLREAPEFIGEYPVDRRWIPESRWNRGNLLVLGLYYSAMLVKESSVERSKEQQVSLGDYMRLRKQKHVDDLFEQDPIIENFLDLIEGFNKFLLETIKTSHEGDDNVVEILGLLTWRWAFYRCSLVNIKKISTNQRHVIVTSLKVHYQWFLKYSIKAVSKLLQLNKFPRELEKVMSSINKSLENELSLCYKFGKNYQKCSSRPPPKISHEEINTSNRLDEALKYFNVCDKSNDQLRVYATLKARPELRKALMQAKISGELAESFGEEQLGQTLSKYEMEIVPFVDYFIRCKTWQGFLSIDCDDLETSSPILPLDLAATLQLYKATKDERLSHELSRNFFTYLGSSASARNAPFAENSAHLLGIHPALVYHTTNLLIGKGSTSTLGNFHELSKQHRIVSLTLWRNCQQLHHPTNDFLHNENEFITATLVTFTKSLALSLNVPYIKLRPTLEKCLSSLSGHDKGGKDDLSWTLIHLRNCLANLEEATCSLNEGVLRVARLHIELSYVKAIFNSRLPLIDPSAVKALKKKYCTENIQMFEELRASFLRYNAVLSGGEQALHSHHGPVVRMIERLSLKNQKLGAYVAVRPENVHYEDVLKSVNHAFRTLLYPEYVSNMIRTLDMAIRELLDNDVLPIDCEKLLKKYESSVSSYENLICEWIRYRSSYPDIIEPLLANLAEFLYGLELILALLKKLMEKRAEKKFNLNVQTDLVALVQIPGLDCNRGDYPALIRSYTSPNFYAFVKSILDDNELAKQEVLRMYKCGIQESFNFCLVDAKISGGLNRRVFKQFEGLVKAFVHAWNQQEQEREEKEKEADALYKTRTKCDDKTEEEQIADELKQLFPNYHEKDFADMQKTNKLADDALSSDRIDEFSGHITHGDIKFVVDLHLILVQTFTRTEWLNPEENKNVTANFINPLIEKYQLFKQILDKTILSMNYRIDRDLIESLGVLLSHVGNHATNTGLIEQNSPTTKGGTNYDFYKDANVEEVKSSRHILAGLRARIVELLEEWPEQPTLKTILTIIDRVYNFDISSPVSRFLTGFEILLAKCHEWEEVAHSGVSLSEFSQNLIHQIIAWRKMELNVWKDLLNTTFIRLNEPIYKWWLVLYNVMEQFTGTGEQVGEQSLIESLQNYMTKSSLAEFESRLKLLHAFHCHSVHLPATANLDSFRNILWNIYSYFSQFKPAVAAKIKDVRAPIEKKLKDYVKIVRWKDINYWSIKETVDKSHKTLHKYVREFQDALRQPVLPCLVNSPNPNNAENVGIWDRPQRGEVKTYHYTLDPTTYLSKETTLKKKLLPNESNAKLVESINAKFSESRKLCSESLTSLKYPKRIQTLDSFVTEIIETSAHLQGLAVDATLEKKKQKSQAKSIQQQKHRALADLFKRLAHIGLSFQTGLVEAKLKMATEEFLMKPIDISANFSYINYKRKDEKILTIWDSCEMYYLKALMRADVLDTALKTPAPDLGLQNIARCRGFSSNLLGLVQRQKVQLMANSTAFYYLRHYTTQMTRVVEAKQFVPSKTIEKMESFLRNLSIVVSQSKLVLNSFPVDEMLGMELHSQEIVVLQPEPVFIQSQHDEPWNKASDLLADLQNIGQKVAAELRKSKCVVPNFQHNLIPLKYVPAADLDALLAKLADLETKMIELVNIFGSLHVANSFNWLITQLEKIKVSIKSHKKNTDEEIANKLKQIKSLVDVLSINIHYVITKVHKSSTLATDDDCSQLEEKHLKELIVTNLEGDLASLNITHLLGLCTDLVSIFFTIPPKQLTEAQTTVSFILPLLEQAILFHQYFLTQQVSAYRISCKMSAILLNIFIELASKGFCVPPEYDDEDGDGVSRPSNGLGLGEGQGERDVSDKIESEDQLDDAQPAGQEKNQEEDPDCKEEDKGIEMSEDFDSKLQDVEKKGDDEDDDDEKSNDSDAEEQMGETEKDADKLDKENFGSDQDEGDEENDKSEEKGDGGEKDGESELAAKDKDQAKENDQKDKDGKEKEQNKKDINEMEEPEFDDEQTDPYHGNQPELPEPEELDLPDDLQLDDGQENDNDGPDEENPFDIDTMKEDNPFEDKKQDENDVKHDEETEFSSDEEEVGREEGQSDDVDESDKIEEKDEIKETEKADSDEPEAEEKTDESAYDQTETNEDNVEAMDVDESTALDKTQPSQAQNQKSNQSIEELNQEDKPDKEGVGQSQMEESSSGHSAQTSAPQQMQNTKRERDDDRDKPQKPGDSDAQRSLGNINEPIKKKLKTMDTSNEEEDDADKPESGETDVEIYKHIKDAKESSTQVLDVATKEQAEEQQVPNLEEEKTGEEPTEPSDTLPEEEEETLESTDAPIQKAEKPETNKSKKEKKQHQHPDGDILEEIQDVEIDGELVETMAVPRGSDTSYHTIFDELKRNSAARLTIEEINNLRKDVEKQLSSWSEGPSDAEADRTWQKITSVTSSLAQDLCEQLRLVLEPTLASRLKGDFRTGRRINMRKVIPYIASQFRKDKIWLRRTKPSKREYQIVLAIDDSSSMADNRSKELAFESVALISKSLTLLESGQLSVVSFGEETEILHKLTDQFTDRSGVKLLQKFRFDQNKTCVAKLVDFVSEMLAQSQMQSGAFNAKLLVIVSDGRGVFSEGETFVRQAVRRAKLSNIFMVFVIVDNPENKHSILDIRMPTFVNGKLLGIENYMDSFPFSFYIILRDINALPNVLSDALRQWFEVVSNLDK